MIRPCRFTLLLLLPLGLGVCAPAKLPPAQPAAVVVEPKAPTTLIVTLKDPAIASPQANAAAMVIAGRLGGCWTAPEPIHVPTVTLHLGLDRNGAVETVDVVDKERFAAEADYRAAAEAATRAIFKCSPFRLPPESHASWESLILLVTPHHA